MQHQVIQQHPLIEEILSSYRDVLTGDYERYRNHVYRVFNYSLYLSDNKEENKYAIAAVFHDLGIWTHHTFDYLKPSVELAKNYLHQQNSTINKAEISEMIGHHHKISTYKGDFENTVEIFRKADWTDVSMHFLHFKIPKTYIGSLEKQFPYLGFHAKLVRLFLVNLVQHPLKPLPMFRK